MFSENEDLIDAAYSSAYKAATFQGNFNPETGKAYADEVVQLFGKGGDENEGNGNRAEAKQRTGPAVKSKASTVSNATTSAKKKGARKPGKGATSKKGDKRGISAKREFMLDISNEGEVAGRRMGTGDNDLNYHLLDGTFPHLLGVVEPFDQNVLTHQEMLMVGIQRGVPSQPKHRKTYIQGLGDALKIKEVGPNFRKEVDLHSAVALETRQAIHAKYPEWIELRENYFRQLEIKAEKVVQLIIEAKREGKEEIEAHSMISDATRQQFLLLLLAVRKVSVRIVGEYEVQCLRVQQDARDHNARDAANNLVKYIFSFPRCFEPFNAPPFTHWTGIDLALNPLITPQDITGKPMLLTQRGVNYRRNYRTGAESVLIVAEDERRHCDYVNGMLRHIFQQRAALGDDFTSYHGGDVDVVQLKKTAATHAAEAERRARRVSGNQGDGEDGGGGGYMMGVTSGDGGGDSINTNNDDDGIMVERGGVSVYARGSRFRDRAREREDSEGVDGTVTDDSTVFLPSRGGPEDGLGLGPGGAPLSHIDNLIRQTTSSVNKALRIDRDKKLFLLGKSKMKWWWRAWKRVYANETKVADAHIVQASRNLRQCFDSLNRNQWVCVKFRGLQQRAHKRLVAQTLEAWKAYSAWTKRFNDIFHRSVRHIKRKILFAMHEFAETVFENRRFRYHSEQRHFVAVFRALKFNVTLSQHELRKRLEHQSNASTIATVFIDRVTLRHLFDRWRKRNNILHGLDDLEELVEHHHMKDALVRWYLLTYGPRSQRTARKIERAKSYVKEFRRSVEDGVRSSYDKLKTGVNSSVKKAHRAIRGPPPPTPEEMDAMRASAEIKRRSRMVNALRYAREAGKEDS